MSLRVLPEIKALQKPRGYSWDVPSDALAHWTTHALAEGEGEPDTITIYDMIGEDPWTGGGFTARRMAAALRAIGNKDVRVKINSPGGSVFEGFAIYNELRQHKAKVSVEIMGIAASAAAYIAMAGDEIRIGLGAFIMVHNAWGVVIGNRNDLAEAQKVLTQIDAAQIDIFEARTGRKRDEIEAYMDAETFFGATDAVKAGFADAIMEEPSGSGVAARAAIPEHIMARRRIEAALAREGVDRKGRADLLKNLTGARDAVGSAPRDAGVIAAGISRLISTLRS